MFYQQYMPPSELRDYIRYYWSYDARAETPQKILVHSFADRFPRLIFQDLSQYEPIRFQDKQTAPVCYLSGIDTSPSQASWYTHFSHFGVSFYPHALSALFGLNASSLVNTTPDICLFVNDALSSKLEKLPNHAERVTLLNQYFYNCLHQYKRDRLINILLHQESLIQTGKTHEICKKYSLSERQLQRRFKASTGISLKRYQNLLRFEQTLALLRKSPQPNLIHLALDSGYYDQAHFINDFFSHSGMTPTQYIQKIPIGSESSSYIYKT